MSEPSELQHSYSFLDLVNSCDNVRVDWSSLVDQNFGYERLVPWRLAPSPDSPVIGLLRPMIVNQLRKENETMREKGSQDVWLIMEDDPKPRVTFSALIDTPADRTVVMKELCERWRDTGLFENVCGPTKWRGEMYPVYSDPFGKHDHPSDRDTATSYLNYAFEMERSACALFGVVTFGVHMTVYRNVERPDSRETSMHVWVPTRAKTKSTWPGYLDNTVAGGIPSGMSVFEVVAKESMEEASIEELIVQKYAKSVGAISYFLRTSKGWLQPEVEYVYDLCIPPGAEMDSFQPKPHDDEVEYFELLPLHTVISKMRAGLFKSNCALVLIDFLIRHGHLTPDNEPDFMKILTRMHGRLYYDKCQ